MNRSGFCPQCGKPVNANANFCSACGAAVAHITQPVPSLRARITRPRAPRMIAGVCSGVALHYGWDLALVRILFTVFTVLTSGLGILIYLIAWVAIPDAQYALPFGVPISPGAAQSSSGPAPSNTGTSA